MRYLTESYIRSALNRNKSVELFLGGDGETIQWISLRLEGENVHVFHFHVEDPGDQDYLDVYTFAPVDENNYEGTLTEFYSIRTALDFCSEKHGAHANHFVNEFMVQDEYRDYLENKNN